MRKFFIASHGRLASGMKTSLNILMGEKDSITVFDAYVDQESLEDHLEKWLGELQPGDQGIMISDLLGGSVNQVMYRYLEKYPVYLIAGANLALVLELAAQSGAPISAGQLDQVIEQSRQMMTRCVFSKEEPSPQEDFFE